jgi:hypothetical protein
VLGRIASETGREPSKLLVSGRSFEDVMLQRMGSAVVAQRLFESQNPGEWFLKHRIVVRGWKCIFSDRKSLLHQ